MGDDIDKPAPPIRQICRMVRLCKNTEDVRQMRCQGCRLAPEFPC
jgi:hypothetical protein